MAAAIAWRELDRTAACGAGVLSAAPTAWRASTVPAKSPAFPQRKGVWGVENSTHVHGDAFPLLSTLAVPPRLPVTKTVTVLVLLLEESGCLLGT